jgi:hypothetical protein
VKLSDVERKPPDILSDLSETEVYCLSDPSVLVSDRTIALFKMYPNPGLEARMLNGESE